MSSFLVNLARRGAGLPTTPIQAPPPSPIAPEIRKQGDELTEVHETVRDPGMAEETTSGIAASETLLRASSAAEYKDVSSAASAHHTPSIQRLSGTEYSTPIPSSIGEPAATTKTPSLGPPSAPQLRVVSPRRELAAARMEPSDLAATPYPTEREVITEIEVERDRHTPASVVHEIEQVGEPARQASSVISAPAILIEELGERQVVALPELSVERPRIGAQQTPETAPPPTIRPALAESHTLLQFPKVTPASSPTPPSRLPIHVRIGRVEVRGTTAPTPMPARPSPAAPLGFDSYYRVRNYRS